LLRIVENEVKRILPNLFAVSFDGWDQEGSGVKYVAVFASFSHKMGSKRGIATQLTM
jgi:hypothetical protein